MSRLILNQLDDLKAENEKLKEELSQLNKAYKQECDRSDQLEDLYIKAISE